MSTPAARARRKAGRRGRALIRDNEWALPLIGAIVGTVLGFALFNVDGASGSDWAVTVSLSRATLATLVALMFTILSLSMSLTTLTLDNLSGHLSMRMLTVAASDYRSRIATSVFALAVSFIGVELYKLTDYASDELTPRIPFAVAMLLIIASGVALFWQLNYTIQSLRLDRSLTRLKRVTQRSARSDTRRFRGWGPAARPVESDAGVALLAEESSYVIEHDLEALREVAQTGQTIAIDAEVGAPVVIGEVIGWVDGPDVTASILADVWSAVDIGPGRDAGHDAGFAIRIFVDIASLALSPAVNDPYTAVQVVDQLSAVFADLARGQLGPRALSRDGDVVAWVAAPTLADHLELATEQISRYGASERQVVDSLVGLCDTVERCATSDDERTAASDRRRAVLASATGSTHYSRSDR